MNLQNQLDYFYNLYGCRNSRYLRYLNKRINFLLVGINDLRELQRIDVPTSLVEDVYGIAIVRIFTRLACVADYFKMTRPIKLAKYLSAKFPLSGCTYCGHLPCVCPPKFGKFTLADPNFKQINFLISQWQSFLGELYGQANEKKSFHEIVGRLNGEAIETVCLELGHDKEFRSILWHNNSYILTDELHLEFTLELCDIFAWLIAIANKLHIDLEDAIENRFKNNCWNCHESHCSCKEFNFKPINWKQFIAQKKQY